MLNKFKYVLKGIRQKKLTYLIVFIQIFFSLLILNRVIHMRVALENRFEGVNEVLGGKTYYQLIDRSDEGALFQDSLAQDDSLERMEELYSFLRNHLDFEFFHSNSSNVWIDNFKGDENFYRRYITRSEIGGIEGEFTQVHAFYICRDFFDLFDFEIYKGNRFKKEDFTEFDSIPVILGNDYEGIYDVGDTLKGIRLNKKQFRVIGILDSDNISIDSSVSPVDIIPLDNKIIIPFDGNIVTSSIPNYDMLINNSLIKTENKDTTFQQIQNKSQELNLFTFDMISTDEQIEDYVERVQEDINYFRFIFLVVILFCSIGIITSLLNNIERKNREIAVHLMSGATIHDIAIRLVLEMAIVIYSPFIVLNIFTPFSVQLFIYCTVFLFLLVLIPVLKIYNLEINELIRRKE